MKQTERVLVSLLGIGVVLKLMGDGDQGLLLALSGLSLICFYLLSFALLNDIPLRQLFKKSAYAHTNAGRLVGAFAVGMVLSMVCLALLYKLQLWPGAGLMVAAPITFLVPVLIIAWVRGRNKPGTFYGNVRTRLVVASVVLGLLLALPSPTLVDFYYRNDPVMGTLIQARMADPTNPAPYRAIDSLNAARRSGNVEWIDGQEAESEQ